MICTRVASYASPHCVQGHADVDEVVRDEEDPEAEGAVSSVTPAQRCAACETNVTRDTAPLEICETDAGHGSITGRF